MSQRRRRAPKRVRVRVIRADGDVAFVPLTQGYEAIIDVADVPLVDGFNWRAIIARHPSGEIRTVYAIRQKRVVEDDNPTSYVAMHRAILGTGCLLQTDHIDGNGLNNRRYNLRQATPAQNQWNSRSQINNTSGGKGVTLEAGRWRARITINGKRVSIGLFGELDAARAAYKSASQEMHGNFGRTE